MHDGFIGFGAKVTLKKALAGLKRKRFIEYDPEQGYRLAIEWSDGQEMTWVWCWPLAFGHLSVRARIVLPFVDEFIDGRYYINRTQLMKSLGMSSSAFYRVMAELKDAGLILETGRQVGRKGRHLLCVRRANDYFRQLLDKVMARPDYLLHGRESLFLEPTGEGDEGYGEGHQGMPRGTLRDTERDFQKGSPKGSPLGSRERRASLPGGSLRQHIIRQCNIKDPAYLEERLRDSKVLDKLNSLTQEEQHIIQAVHKGDYVNDWTSIIRAWDPLRYLRDRGATAGDDGSITVYDYRPPHDIDRIKALLQAKPELRAQLVGESL